MAMKHLNCAMYVVLFALLALPPTMTSPGAGTVAVEPVADAATAPIIAQYTPCPGGRCR